MWTASRIFWFVAIAIGSFATVLAWMLTTCLAPTNGNWKALSVLTALTAVVQVPVFLLLEAQPCVDHRCRLDAGCYLLIMSTVFWTTVTFLTQYLDPPLWAQERNAWRVSKSRLGTTQNANAASGGNGPTDDTATKMWQRWKRRRHWASQRWDGQNASNLALAYTESASQYEEGVDGYDPEQAGYDDREAMLQRTDKDNQNNNSNNNSNQGRKQRKQRGKNKDGPQQLLLSQSPNQQQQDGEEHDVEQGSSYYYYAESNDSRLLLNVRDGRKPGDDQKSVTTFGDLDDFVRMAEEARMSSLLVTQDSDFPDDEDVENLAFNDSNETNTSTNTNTNNNNSRSIPDLHTEQRQQREPPTLSKQKSRSNTATGTGGGEEESDASPLLHGESLLEMPAAKEIMIIHSHQDSPNETSPPQYYTNPDAFVQETESDTKSNNPKGGLLLDGRDVVEAQRAAMMEAGSTAKLTASIRALTTRIRRDTTRTRCGKCYSAMDDASDVDDDGRNDDIDDDNDDHSSGRDDSDDEDLDRGKLYVPPIPSEIDGIVSFDSSSPLTTNQN